MRILLLGATGRVGSEILKLAVADKHDITVLVRAKEKLDVQNDIKIVEGNVLDQEVLVQAAKGADVVVSALGTDKTTTLSESTPKVIQVMKANGIKRIITVGTAGILTSRTQPPLYRYESSESRLKTTRAAKEHRKMYETLSESNLDWTIVCPTYLPDGPAKGNYRVNEDVLPENGREISVGDTAQFVYQELQVCNHLYKRVGIAY
ncbi:SDR family oxidoreductase [Pseudalkalibacillus hwajinpoensis]|uniref:NAD(P)-dependent oxidoreductase n=1 Tax=Guptibacillus hwajinpoensis TaxID=208199 RepID=UPI00325A7565